MKSNKCDICKQESNKTKYCPNCGNEVCPKCWDKEHYCCPNCAEEVIHTEILNDIEEW